MRMRQLPAFFALVALALTGCATAGSVTREVGQNRYEQYEVSPSAADRAEQRHKVRAWRSAQSFALGGGY